MLSSQPSSLIKIQRRRVLPPVSPDESIVVVSGWAGLVVSRDAQDHVVGLVLPGDIVAPSNETTFEIQALTPLEYDVRPSPSNHSPILGYVVRQCVRLQLPGADQVMDLLQECYERLSAAGLAANGEFELPDSQQLISKILGMSEVHLSRILGQLKTCKRLLIRRRQIWLQSANNSSEPERPID